MQRVKRLSFLLCTTVDTIDATDLAVQSPKNIHINGRMSYGGIRDWSMESFVIPCTGRQ